MSQIEWDDSYSIFDPEIDAQHKKWLSILNTMHTKLLNGGIEELSSLAANSLQEMQNYAEEHFKFEEGKMQKCGYPHLTEHRRLHENFNSLIDEYVRDIQEGKLVLNTSIIKIVKNWLLDHILVEDKKFGQFISSQNS